MTNLLLFLLMIATASCDSSRLLLMNRFAPGAHAVSSLRYRPVSAFVFGDIKKISEDFGKFTRDFAGAKQILADSKQIFSFATRSIMITGGVYTFTVAFDVAQKFKFENRLAAGCACVLSVATNFLAQHIAKIDNTGKFVNIRNDDSALTVIEKANVSALIPLNLL